MSPNNARIDTRNDTRSSDARAASNAPTPELGGDHVVSKLKRTPEDYIKERVEYKINRYEAKADRNRYFYLGMAGVAAAGSVLVPALINLFRNNTIVPTLVGVLVAFLVSLEALFHTRQLWRNYDLVAALLRSEEMHFSTRTGPYAPGKLKEGEDPFPKFVERVEAAIANERAETIVMRTTPPSNGQLNQTNANSLQS